MKINYIEKEKSIEIKDGFKTYYRMIIVVMIFNITNAILFPIFVLDDKPMEWFGITWMIIGVISLLALAYQLIKKSASEKLKLSEISALNERKVFGQKKISLKLKNGKWRDLMETKTESDVKKVKTFFQNIGVATVGV